jgi:hypothetical protein
MSKSETPLPPTDRPWSPYVEINPATMARIKADVHGTIPELLNGCRALLNKARETAQSEYAASVILKLDMLLSDLEYANRAPIPEFK